MQEFKYFERYKYPTYLVLNLTDNCNLACKYCFVQQKPHYMTLDVAKKAIDFLEYNFKMRKEKQLFTSYNNRKTIVFFGGEPTLLFDEIIVPLMKYIENNYGFQDYVFHITTNCTLLDERKVKFLHKYKIMPLLSIDGDEFTQNYNRPSKNSTKTSFEMINQNIPIILKYFPTALFRSTVYKDTISYLYENYLYAEKMNFKYYLCCPDYRSMNWDENDLKEYELQLNKIVFHILEQYQNNQEPKTQFLNIEQGLNNILNYDLDIIENKIRKWEKSFHQDRCGLGTTSCSINYQGDIFTCQEQDSRENGNYFYIGNIYDGIDENLHSNIIKDYIFNQNKMEKCKTCILENLCEHGCPSCQKDSFNNLTQMDDINCKCIEITINATRTLMYIMSKQNNQLFNNYIINKLKNSFEWRR